MKKLNLSILLTVLMSMVGARASAHDIEVANADGVTIYYVRTSNNELAVSCRGGEGGDYADEYSGNVVIPETVTHNYQTYSVTSIGAGAFEDCYNLSSVTIPNSVTSIGDVRQHTRCVGACGRRM